MGREHGAFMHRCHVLATPMLTSLPSPAPARPAPLSLIELRSYRTRRGRREELIAMFEAHFLDAYEAAGATIVATFRHRADADRWVWIRAFTDAASRESALHSFYGGATWKRLANACNATIADVSDAWLLQPLDAAGLQWPPAMPDAGAGAGATPPSPWTAVLLPTAAGDAAIAAAHWRAADPASLALVTADGIPPHPQRRLRAGHWMVAFVRGAAPVHVPAGADALRLGDAAIWPLDPTPRSALR